MGQGQSSPDETKDTDHVEQELELLAQNTCWEVEDLREYYHAFMTQYPSGAISRAVFIDQNTRVTGGPPELWAHVFSLIGASHPLMATNQPLPGEEQPTDRQHDATDSDVDTDDDEADGDEEAMNTGRRVTMAPERRDDDAVHAALRTSYVAGRAKRKGPKMDGMTFSHVMVRLYRAQYSPAEKKLKYMFALLDVDKDGLVSLDDLGTMLAWLYEVPAVQKLSAFDEVPDEHREQPSVRARILMALLDRDGDGYLTQDEFLESCRSDNALLDMLTVIAV